MFLPMKTERLLALHLEFITTDLKRWLELVADDEAVVEFPYVGELGPSGRFEGKAAIAKYFGETVNSFGFEGFTLSNVRIYPTTDPDVAIAEVHGSSRIRDTGKPYEQDYVMVMRAKDGLISSYREYWNPMVVIAALSKEDVK